MYNAVTIKAQHHQNLAGPATHEVTRLLAEWAKGNEQALDDLTPLVYKELRQLAANYLRRERQGHTLQPTALVHEAYLRLVDQTCLNWQNRSHFYGVAARLMRQILVDHARRKLAGKRAGIKVSLEEAVSFERERGQDLICEVDLPENVGGFALTIGGKPQIVVNRDKSAEYRQYTVAHELGHHFLHLAPSPVPNSLLAVSGEMKEFQADAFASSLIVWLTPEKDRDEMLRQNPEFASAITIPILLSVGVILVAVLAHVWFQISSDKSVLEDRT